MENNKNKKSVKLQGDIMVIFCDFIQVFVLTRNHHLKSMENISVILKINIMFKV